MRSSRIFLVAAAHLAAASIHAQSIFFVDLNPSGATNSHAAGTTGTQQAGAATIGGAYGACIWSGSAESLIKLNPTGTSGSGVNATTGTQQAGYAVVGLLQHAALWSGTATSFIDLNPTGAQDSYLFATTGAKQGGFAGLQGGPTVAALWSGTAASFVNLNPTGASSSQIRAMSGTQQAGVASFGGSSVAGIWSGTAASFINRNPTGASHSIAMATTGTQQAGSATFGTVGHAALWSGSAGSFVDLGPGTVYAMTTTQQVGIIGGDSGPGYAALWSGTASSVINLHDSLGSNYSYSSATAIWSDGSVTKVAGSAWNNTTGRNDAILWTITPNSTGTSNISTELAGSGAFTQTSGTTTLSGANTYQGGTTINGGTLVLTGSGTLGAATGSLVVNGGTLDLGSTSQAVGKVTLASGTIQNGTLKGTSFDSTGGRISATLNGPGAFTQTSGTTTLSGANTYQGGTTVNGGTLVLTGSGTLGDASGPVAINGGTLDLGVNNPDIHSDTITVNSGGRLMGSGTIFGNVTINGGRFSPGNSPGILSVTNYTQNGGVLDIEIGGATPGTGDSFHDQVQYTGTASISGDATLAISSWNGYTWSNGQSFRIIQDTDAATLGFSGKFAHLTGAIGLVSYDSASATVTLYDSLASVPRIATKRTAPFLGALSAKGGPAPAPIQDKLAAGDVTGAQQLVTNASQIGLASLTAMPVAASARDSDFLRSRENTARAADESQYKWETYAQAHGTLTSAKTGSDAPNFDHNIYGGKVGLDYGKSSVVGVVAGYDIGKATLLNGGGAVDANRASLMAYFTQTFAEHGFAQVGLGGGMSSYESTRNTFAGTAKGDTDGTDLNAELSFGYNVKLGDKLELTPYAGIAYTHAAVSGFTETGSSLALNVDDYSQDSLRAKIGGDFGWKISKQVRIGLDLSLEQELMDHEVEIPAVFATGGGSFTTKAAATPETILSVGPNLRYGISETTSVSIGYKYQIGFDANMAHQFDAAFNCRF